MGKRMKSYLAFTTFAYRLVLFLLTPFMVIGIQTLLSPLGDSGLALGLYLTASLMVEVEIIMDYWAFGAVAVKNNSCLEFLKTSAKGLNMMKTALWQNTFRMFAESLLLLLLGVTAHYLARGEYAWLTKEMGAQEPAKLLTIVMAVYLLAVGGQLITRHFDSIHINVCAAILANIVLHPLLMAVIDNAYFSNYYVLVVLTLLAVSISAIGFRRIMSRVEEGYYDERF